MRRGLAVLVTVLVAGCGGGAGAHASAAAALEVAAREAVPQVDIGYVAERPAIDAIMAAGRDTQQLAHDLQHLTDVIGPRLTGSASLRRAIDWVTARLREDGADSVWAEPFRLGRGWERGPMTLWLTVPHRRPLVGASWGWAPGTDGLLEGDVAYVDARSLADFEARYAGRLAGRWVMIRPPAPVRPAYAPPLSPADSAAFDARRRAHFAPPPPAEAELRRHLPRLLLRERAAGLVRDAERPAGRLTMSGSPDQPYPFPYLIVAHEVYTQFHRLLARGERVAIAADVRNRFTDSMRVENVVAEIRGTERPDEHVIVGAHLDSWDLAAGASDNAAGVAAVIGAARVLRASGVRPRRSIRFVLFSGEEQGLHGADAYVRAHRAELGRIQAVLVVDNGAARIDGMSLQGREEWRSAWRDLFAPVAALGPFTVRSRSKGASDHRAFVAYGVPGFNYDQQEGRGYDDTYHNELDAFDHAWPAELQQAATVMAVQAHALANLPGLLPRLR